VRRLLLPGAGVALIVLLAFAAPLLPLADPVAQDTVNRLAPWLPGSPLGRDEFGRDVLSRLIWGAQSSLQVAFASSAIACVIGVTLGLLAGWFRGVAEFLSIRSADVLLCFPPILLALLVVTLLGPGTGTLIFVLSLLYLPNFIRVAYAEVLSARTRITWRRCGRSAHRRRGCSASPCCRTSPGPCSCRSRFRSRPR